MMRKRQLIVSLAALALLTCAPVRAQVTFKPGNPTPANGKANLPEKVSISSSVRASLAQAKRVSMTLSDASAEQALRNLLDESELGYEFDEALYTDNFESIVIPPTDGKTRNPSLDLPPRRVTMKLVNATLPNALDSVCRALGLGWTATVSDDFPIIRIVRLRGTVTRSDVLGQGGGFGGGGLAGGGGGFGGGGVGNGSVVGFIGGSSVNRDERAYLIETLARVSIDIKDKPVREPLIEVLKAAKAEYVFEEEVVTAPKVTVLLKDVTLRTALDALCESAGLGWTIEGVTPPGKPTTQTIRVGKRYAPKAQ